jgi:hypothetical protein
MTNDEGMTKPGDLLLVLMLMLVIEGRKEGEVKIS